MSDPNTLSQADTEILLTRELRKAGIEVARLAVRRRDSLAAEAGRWVLVLEGRLRARAREERVLIECHSRAAPVGRALVAALADALRASHQLDAAMMLATAGYEPDAVALAAERGVALLALVDGAAAWRASGWGVMAHPPSWFPEVAAQVVRLTELGEVRAELLAADRPEAIFDRLRGKGA